MKLFILLSIIVAINAQESPNEIDLNKIQPTEPYLQGWAKKFTELHEIPLCDDVPKKSNEEVLIEAKCPPLGMPQNATICLNIRLFAILRNLCWTDYEQNKAKWITIMDNMVSEHGLWKFISQTTDFQIFQRIEQETDMKLTNFQKRNFRNLWLNHIVDLIEKSNDKK